MLDKDYNIKIIDFGESKWSINDNNNESRGNERRESYAGNLQTSNLRMPRETFVGTPNYMSPEIFLR
jgi:serine/threonine protein kinase